MGAVDRGSSRLDDIPTRESLLQAASTGDSTASHRLLSRYVRPATKFALALTRNEANRELAAGEVLQEALREVADGILSGHKPDANQRLRDYIRSRLVAAFGRWKRQRQRDQRHVPADAAAFPDPWDTGPADDDPFIQTDREVVIRAALASVEEHEKRYADQGCVDFVFLNVLCQREDKTSQELAAQMTAATGRPHNAALIDVKRERLAKRFAPFLCDAIARHVLVNPTPDEVVEELARLGLLAAVRRYLDPVKFPSARRDL